MTCRKRLCLILTLALLFTALLLYYQSERQCIALIVPFRDRFDELLLFLPHMQKFFANSHRVQVLIVNQADRFRFNRGALINIGVRESTCETLCIHDVDLLPLNRQLDYWTRPASGTVRHLAAPTLHPLYSYEKFFGGVVIIGREDFARVDGMATMFWGWGLEDDEFYERLSVAGFEIQRPNVITTGRDNTFRHLQARKRLRDSSGYERRRQSIPAQRRRRGGLSTLRYQIVGAQHLSVVADDDFVGDSRALARVISVQLQCDETLTPDCVQR